MLFLDLVDILPVFHWFHYSKEIFHSQNYTTRDNKKLQNTW